jgi:ATP-dependent DNA helicase RecG
MSDPRRTSPASPRLTLDTPMTYLKGVGPARAQALGKLGVIFARDLLYHVPHRYEDASTVSRIADLEAGMDGTVIGSVISKGVIPTRKGLRIFQAVVKDASGMMEVSWPGQPFLDRTISKGDVLLLTGTVRFFHGRQLQPREFVNLGAEEQGTGGGRVLSVYPATEGLSFKQIRTLVDTHLDVLLPQVREPLPPDLLALAGVPPLPDALRMVHRPSSIAEALEGRSRLAFEELLCVHILHRRANALARERRDGIAFVNRRDLTTAMKSSLPFELTGAQTRALREIVVDMTSERRMHRLLQGDVGSGKTIVALFACLLAMENGWQAAVMAPTELLAEQHQRTFSRLLAPMAIRPMLVTGRLAARERREAAEVMARPAPLLVIGTHALVQEATQFARLGFVAVDEQHRFGVEQRKALGAKGESPDVLLMSATPIPRSLALTLYGDLDVSTLDEKPPGRRRSRARCVPRAPARACWRSSTRSSRRGGRRTSSTRSSTSRRRADLKAATVAYEELTGARSRTPRRGCCHGRMPGDDKDAVMRAFRDGELDVLVATDGDRGRHRRAQRDGDAHRAPRALRALAAAPAARPGGRGGEQSYCSAARATSGPKRPSGCAVRVHRGRVRDRARRPAPARHGRPVRRTAERAAGVPHRRSAA